MSIIDIRLVALRDGRWIARVEGRRAPLTEADRPSSVLALLARALDRAARHRPERDEVRDPSSALFASTDASARAAVVLDELRRRGP